MRSLSKSFFILGILFIVGLVFTFPETISATTTAGIVTCDGYNIPCDTCKLTEMVNTGIKLLFGAVGLIFAVIMMKAGLGLTTSGGNQAALEAAKRAFQNAIIGLLIIMAAWLLVDTLMRTLLKDDGDLGATFTGWGPWSEVRCVSMAVTQPWSRSPTDGLPPGDVTPPAVEPGTMSHADAVAALGGAFTISSSGSCSDRNMRSCTSLDGIRTVSINRIREFQAAVGIPLVITGGTEVGHAAGTYSHGNGYKIDLRIDDTLNTYITTNFTPAGASKWKDVNGNIFYRHGPPDHWDITFTN